MRAKYRTTIVRLAGELRADRSPAEPQVRSRPSRNRQPNKTRDALLEAAARIFNSAGYHGTDSNRIAREAGYAPGTFYVHFADKLAIFLEVYEGWVSTEWASDRGYPEVRRPCPRIAQAPQPRRARAPSQVADLSREPARTQRHR